MAKPSENPGLRRGPTRHRAEQACARAGRNYKRSRLPNVDFRRVPEYRVAVASSASDLALAVNELAADGWTPLGGIGVRSWVETEYEKVHRGQDRRIRTHYSELMQAMVREKSE